MSELKAFRIIQGDTGGYGAPSYKCDTDGNRLEEWCDICEVYDKFEADKVIADLELKVASAQLVLRFNTPEALYSNLETMSRLNHKIDVVERRELHQKYKRCLAMARWCDSEMNYWYDRIEMEQCPRFKFFARWQKRWLELAKRFK